MKTKLMIFAVFLWLTAIVQAVPARITTLAVATGGVQGYKVKLSLVVPASTTAVTSIEVRMSTVPITAMNYATRTIFTTILSPGVAGTTITLNVTGLTPNTTYYFAAKAKDTVWATIVSNMVMQQTAGATKTILVAATYDGDFASAIYFYHGKSESTLTQNRVDVDMASITQKMAKITITGLNWADDFYIVAYVENSAGSTVSNIAFMRGDG